MRAEILLPNFLEIRCVEQMHAAARTNSNPVTRKEMDMPSKSKENIATAANVSRIQAEETAEASVRNAPRDGDIRRRAYEIYLERGAEPGREMEDWLQAEREAERGALGHAQGS
jgi:hypothetical protein